MKLFKLVKSFDVEVLLHNDSGTEAETSSLIGLLMLDSVKGWMIEVEATRPEVQTLMAVIELFNTLILGLTRINPNHVSRPFTASL